MGHRVYDFFHKIKILLADILLTLMVLHIAKLPPSRLHAVQDDIERKQLVLVLLLGTRNIKLDLPAEIGGNLLVFGDRDNRIRTVSGRINRLSDVNIIESVDRIASVRLCLYGMGAARWT